MKNKYTNIITLSAFILGAGILSYNTDAYIVRNADIMFGMGNDDKNCGTVKGGDYNSCFPVTKPTGMRCEIIDDNGDYYDLCTKSTSSNCIDSTQEGKCKYQNNGNSYTCDCKKFTCVRKGDKYDWDKGVVIKTSQTFKVAYNQQDPVSCNEEE